MKMTKYSITRHGLFRKSYKVWEGKTQVFHITTDLWLKGMTLRTMDDQEVLYVKKTWSMFSKKFDLIINGEIRAEFTSNSSFSNSMDIATVMGLYFVDGNFWGNDYTIENEKEPIAKIARNSMSKTRYGIAIKPGHDNIFILGIVMVIELLGRIKKAEKS